MRTRFSLPFAIFLAGRQNSTVSLPTVVPMVLVVLVVLVFPGGLGDALVLVLLLGLVGRPFFVARPGPVGPGKAVGFVTIITSVSFCSEEYPFWNF